MILQKDSRARRIVDGASDPMIGVEESKGERQLMSELRKRRARVHANRPVCGIEVPARVVDTLPHFVAPRTNHKTPI